MIEGEIRDTDGLVSRHIEATVTIAGISGRVEFLIDTGAYATALYPNEQVPFRGNIAVAWHNAPIAVAEGVGGVAAFRRIAATLAFDDRETARPWEYRTEIYIVEPEAKTTNPRHSHPCWGWAFGGAGSRKGSARLAPPSGSRPNRHKSGAKPARNSPGSGLPCPSSCTRMQRSAPSDAERV